MTKENNRHIQRSGKQKELRSTFAPVSQIFECWLIKTNKKNCWQEFFIYQKMDWMTLTSERTPSHGSVADTRPAVQFD